MRLAIAQPGVLLEAQLARQAGRAADDVHGAPVVHVYLPNDQVVDAGHHLRRQAGPTGGAVSCNAPVEITDNKVESAYYWRDLTGGLASQNGILQH